jgi:type IV fimbrial biogenesis protein FimT
MNIPPSRYRHSARGFTLTELLTTLAVAAVLVGIAVPNFRDFTIRNRLATVSNDFLGTIHFARSEAIRRGSPVTICRSSDGATCSGSWSDGWIVFANTDNDDPAEVDAGEPVLKVYGGVGNSYALNADATLATHITFGRDGAALSTGLFSVCHDNKLRGSRAIIVTRLRPRMAADTDGDRIPNRDDGANISNCATPGV